MLFLSKGKFCSLGTDMGQCSVCQQLMGLQPQLLVGEPAPCHCTFSNFTDRFSIQFLYTSLSHMYTSEAPKHAG